MELVRMYQSKIETQHYKGCLLNKWGVVVMATFEQGSKIPLQLINPDTNWYNRFFNSKYYYM